MWYVVVAASWHHVLQYVTEQHLSAEACFEPGGIRLSHGLTWLSLAEGHQRLCILLFFFTTPLQSPTKQFETYD